MQDKSQLLVAVLQLTTHFHYAFVTGKFSTGTSKTQTYAHTRNNQNEATRRSFREVGTFLTKLKLSSAMPDCSAC